MEVVEKRLFGRFEVVLGSLVLAGNGVSFRTPKARRERAFVCMVMPVNGVRWLHKCKGPSGLVGDSVPGRNLASKL